MVLTSDPVETTFKRLIPADARVVAVAIPEAPADWPLPLELRKAKTSRQREFIAGRWCASRVLALLGVTGEVGRRDDRAPTWPIGVAGAISHTRELAVAAGWRGEGLGIDLEPMLTPDALNDLRASTIDDDEWRVLGEELGLATALFSAKESIFKCEYPRTGTWLEFTDAKLVARDAEALTLRLKTGDLRVRYALEEGHAFTAVAR